MQKYNHAERKHPGDEKFRVAAQQPRKEDTQTFLIGFIPKQVSQLTREAARLLSQREITFIATQSVCVAI